MIKAESAVPEGLCHVGDAVLAHDVEGEAAGACHDAGIVADAAFVLVAGDIADIVVAVLDAPMASDGGGPIGCGEPGSGGYVIGNLAALAPQAGGSGVEQGVAGDTDDGLDEGLPLGPGQGIADREDLDGAVFLAGSALVARERGIGGSVCAGDSAGGLEQIGLVGLQLDQEVVAGVTGNLECFFDSAWRRE